MLDEVGPIVTYDYTGATKTWKYDLFKELGHTRPSLVLVATASTHLKT